MDSSRLRSLAAEGFEVVPGDLLTTLAAWCREWCVATGDARFCIIGDTLAALDEWRREHDEAGGVPTRLLDDIESHLTRNLAMSISAERPVDGAYWADTMRREVLPLLLPPSQWPDL